MTFMPSQQSLCLSLLLLALPAMTPRIARAQAVSMRKPRDCVTVVDPHGRSARSYIDDRVIKAIVNAERGNSEGKYILYTVSIDTKGAARTELNSTNMAAEQ